MTLHWRKRVEYKLLKWQGRFEGTTFDKVFPWSCVAFLWIIFALLALARSRELSQDANLAAIMQSVWLIGEGFTPDASLLGQNYFSLQGGFLIYPITVLTRVFPTAMTLMIIQSGALALTVVPLWRLSRNVAQLRTGASTTILLVYGVFSAVHAVNLAGFHLETLALPLLMAAVYSTYIEKSRRYWIFITLVLLARADLGIAVAGLGILWLLEGKKKIGYQTLSFGLAWSTIFILGVQPLYYAGHFPHVDAFTGYGGNNPFSVVWGIIIHPWSFVTELFSEPNFLVAVSLLAPVLFLPVVAPRYLIPALPLFSLYLTADVPEGELMEASQTVPITVFIFVALVFALAKTGNIVVQRVNVDRAVIGALIFTAAVFFTANSISSPYEEPWSWGRRDPVDIARLEVAEMVPEDAVVRASQKILPLLTERVGLHEFNLPEEYDDRLGGEAVRNVNWFIFDRSEVPRDWNGVDILDFQADIRVGQRFVQVYSNSGIEAYVTPMEAQRQGLNPLTND
jgi:uncharacterized membrane protein